MENKKRLTRETREIRSRIVKCRPLGRGRGKTVKGRKKSTGSGTVSVGVSCPVHSGLQVYHPGPLPQMLSHVLGCK